MTTKIITERPSARRNRGRCDCGAPVAINSSTRCETCVRFVDQIRNIQRRKSTKLSIKKPFTQEENITRARARSQQWYLDNKDKAFARNREWYADNPERVRASQRRHLEKRYREIESMPKIPCACGCGTMIAPITRGLRPARYAQWHKKTGGRTLRGGYVLRRVGKDHPLADKQGLTLEHRLVMSEAIGRPLDRWETVHHINGDRSDNRLENLQLRQGNHGPGVAYTCCDCGSHNVEPTQLLDTESGQTHLVLGGDQ